MLPFQVAWMDEDYSWRFGDKINIVPGRRSKFRLVPSSSKLQRKHDEPCLPLRIEVFSPTLRKGSSVRVLERGRHLR